MSDEIDIGQIGESRFKSWCDDSALTANKSTIDKKGWDYIVQFSSPLAGEPMQDRAAEEISSFFQVKTTKHLGNPIQIKLSNWNSMIRIPMPAFVAVVLLDSANSTSKVFLVHVGKELISEVLEAMRKTKKKLHKVSMRLPIQPSDEVTPPFGESIKSRVTNQISGNFRKYVREKSDILETVGYKEYVGRGKFTVKSSLSELVDFSIGLKPSIGVSDFKMETGLRFDIPERTETLGNAIVEFSREGSPIVLEISNDKGLHVTYPGEVFDPFFLLPSVSVDVAKFRIKSEIGEIVVGPGSSTQAKFSISIPRGEIPFSELIRFAKTASIFNDATSDFDVSLSVDGKRSIHFTVRRSHIGDISGDESVLMISSLALSVSRILNHYMADLSFLFSADELAEQRGNILELLMILEGANEPLGISFKTNSPIEEGKRIVVPRVVDFRTKTRSYITIAYFSGLTSQVGVEGGVYSHTGVFKIHKVKQLSKAVDLDYNLDKEWEIATSEVQKLPDVMLYLERSPNI